jgi:hypothetical protein
MGMRRRELGMLCKLIVSFLWGHGTNGVIDRW